MGQYRNNYKTARHRWPVGDGGLLLLRVRLYIFARARQNAYRTGLLMRQLIKLHINKTVEGYLLKQVAFIYCVVSMAEPGFLLVYHIFHILALNVESRLNTDMSNHNTAIGIITHHQQ